MNKKRPVNLDLGSLKYPPMAIASILHRISGVVLFILLPMMLYFLSLSLGSQDSFLQVRILLSKPLIQCLVWAFCVAFMYHLLAGLRHLFMDIGWGEQLGVARVTARLVMLLAIVFAIFLGFWIW